ncbi:hypothetical protein PAPYR_3597 [Paratrimastix pyriformis]|uniref:Ribosome maturation protein SDO1/SBDS N-terminal domain-containing protein n=1 Tax=Paratrimastix pyriformis TaxID=342808 RepID=A0ABQ8UN37_9EUKA|nr:hypothetical protein PAPYR_3597 [Paratrimastix pyriformis]
MSNFRMVETKAKEEKGERHKHQFGKRFDVPAQVVTLHIGHDRYQVLVNAGDALRYRRGEVRLEDALVSDTIYDDANNGYRAGNLENVFETRNHRERLERILREGEIQLTSAEKKDIEPKTLAKRLVEHARRMRREMKEGDKIFRGHAPTTLGGTLPNPSVIKRRKSLSIGVKESKGFLER